MRKQPNEKEIEYHLNKIKNDEIFTNSTQYFELLKLIISETLDGNQLKEVTLGIKFFGENYTTKNTGFARVYVYNLRKKLKSYYAGNGAKDRLKFILEKGSYKIRFEQESKSLLYNSVDSKPLIYTLLTAIIAIAIWAIIATKKEYYCWDSFLKNGTTNTCVLADHLVVDCQIDNTPIAAIHPDVDNSTILNKKIDDSTKLKQFTLFTKSIPHSLYRLTKWFINNESDFVMTLESELKFESTKHSNIIYIGQYKTMGVSKEYFLRGSKFTIKGINSTLKRSETTTYSPKFDGRRVVEYAMVSYTPLENGHKALYFVSNNDIGTMATVASFTNADSLHELFQEIPTDRYFNALFKVEGLERTSASCKLVDIELINQ